MTDLTYLQAYPPDIQARVRELLAQNKLGDYLNQRYPGHHEVQTDKALYQYTMAIKQEYLRKAPPIDKVRYDAKLDVLHQALGLHTALSRNHGGRLQAVKEIRIGSVFKQAAPEFLNMIVVHELAHVREIQHNKAFYQLCQHMLPDYHQLEFDFRLFLTWRDWRGEV